MKYRRLGRTGVEVSAIAFGAGPISTLMVGNDLDAQLAVVEHALGRGINWFDTAATYGAGNSEGNLGRVLQQLDAASRIHIATKVRLVGDDVRQIGDAVRRSFEQSLGRLRLPKVTLLQLHNSITRQRDDEPTSITPADVLGPGGVLAAFERLRAEGLVDHLGLTGIGQPQALVEVVRSGQFDAMQVPYHLLNPSAGCEMEPGFDEVNYGNVIAECARAEMGVLAIRVLAGGALAGNPPSPHTFKTAFFPLDLYERDRQRAARLTATLEPGRKLPHEAIRFALAHPAIHSALIGFAHPWQIDEAVEALESDAPTCHDRRTLVVDGGTVSET